MPKKSGGSHIIRKSGADLPKRDQAHLEALRAAAKGPIDTSDIGEKTGSFNRLRRREKA